MPGSALIGNLAVNLSLETAAFSDGATYAEKRMAGLQKKMQAVGANLTKVGAGLSLAVTTPLLAFSKGAFDAAKDAAELQSAFNATFGNLAEDMNKWAEATGNAMGRSTREIQEGANAFGLYFNQASKTRVEAAKLSGQFTVLAQDLASFHNTGVDEALGALRSGLSGETEPLRRFGVFLNEAAVAAKAAELGLQGVNGKLTDQEKIMARAAVIMEQTKTAQGDVARTSGSTANQIRASQAAWEELQITIGTKLLPVLTPLITAVTKVLEKFNQLSPATQTWVVGIAAVAAGLGPFLLALGPVVTAFGALLPLIVKLGPLFSGLVPLLATLGRALLMLAVAGGPLTLIALAVGAVYLAWQNWDKIEPILRRLYEAVKTWVLDRLNAVWENVKTKIESVKRAFYNLYDAVVGHSYIPDMVTQIGNHLARLDYEMVSPAQDATAKTAQAFANMAQSTVSSIQSIIDAIKRGDWGSALNGILSVVSTVAGAFGGGGGVPSTDFGMNPTTGPIGMARGGLFRIGGRGGLDANVLSLNGSPIAKVSNGETGVIIPRGGLQRSEAPMSLSFHNDFRGADASAVAAIIARIDRFDAELPGRAVAAIQDAKSRFVIR